MLTIVVKDLYSLSGKLCNHNLRMFWLDSDLHSTADQTHTHDQTSLWKLLRSLGDPEEESFYSVPAMFNKYGPLTFARKYRT